MEPNREKLVLPNGGKKLLLHSCCAPCSGGIIKFIQDSNIDFAIFYYNPNIHPKKEYEIRKEENIRFAEKCHVPIIDAEYDTDNWYARAKGLEFEPERGIRCTMCFDMRLERTALYAYEHGFDVIATSLGISRWKNLDQVNDSGRRAAEKYEGITYWDYNWRKKGGSACNLEICKYERFYKQEYCGCAYSLRDANQHRLAKGQERIQIGVKFYGEETNNK
ncbi:epoxyqueuosine reductase QueH [Capnocytophaga sp. G2]|uniref:epoxyqueuosine reductase QueH n=1 Tax=Capnocytophaga sp. G2 TaxID=3110695 RepID=UPI002B4761D8|nr:epoxyqueuosine reductase QueH [Capnocytophaga sp. G2]MEB3005222.1 epoxyqueuosine reductase QueH [Capnocytophaga sp. G2]